MRRTMLSVLLLAGLCCPLAAAGGVQLNPDQYAVLMDHRLSVAAPGVLANDVSRSAADMQVLLLRPATHGHVSLQADGSFKYRPPAGFFGMDEFRYCLDDGTGDVPVWIEVIGPGLPPVAADETFTALEDTDLDDPALNVLHNDSAFDGGPLEAMLVKGPQHGHMLLRLDGTFVYKPDADFNGTDSFTYMVIDIRGETAMATALLEVQPVNDPPRFSGGDVSVLQDSGTVTIAAWAGGIDPGAYNEGHQVLVFEVDVIAGASMFIGMPRIDGNGDLEFTLAPGQAGFAWIGVRLIDYDPLTHESAESTWLTFRIDVVASPVQPDFISRGDVTVEAVAGQVYDLEWVEEILPGNMIAEGDELVFEVLAVSAPGMFLYGPEVNAETGQLHFVLAEDTAGHAMATVVLVQPQSGIMSEPQTFAINAVRQGTLVLGAAGQAPAVSAAGRGEAGCAAGQGTAAWAALLLLGLLAGPTLRRQRA